MYDGKISDCTVGLSNVINIDAIKEEDSYNIDNNDKYLSMTLGIPRGLCNDLHYAEVKK